MVNSNIQGPIPLEGSGYIAKNEGNYLPGEYRRLVNCELVDGIIKNRRNIQTVYPKNLFGDDTARTLMTNPYGFVGYFGSGVVTTSKTEQRLHYENEERTLWAPTNLPVDASAGSFHRIVGVFRYNNINYWITHKFDANLYVTTLYLYSEPVNSTIENISSIVFADLDRVTIYTQSMDTKFAFNGFFIQGERLWISTSNGVYFSKATDPTVFSVPDGGFFKFQGQKINYSFFLQDTIFVLCDNSTFTINYSSDPNVDSVARQVSDAVGGEHGCVHLDTAYMVNSSGIYAIHANSVEKLKDNKFDLLDTYLKSKLTSFEDYLIVNQYSIANYAGANEFNPPSFTSQSGPKFIPNTDGKHFNYNVFFINTITGATHVVDFTDNREAATLNKRGYITDVIVNPVKGAQGRLFCYFLVNRYVSGTDALFSTDLLYKGSVYRMDSFYEDQQLDYVINGVGQVRLYQPKYDIEIDSYTPDGTEYLVKKFRNLEMMGDLPSHNFKIQFAFDNQDYGTAVDISQALTEKGPAHRGHYPCRLGLNQRGRSVNIRMFIANGDTKFADNSFQIPAYHKLEISDMRVLWGYTGRGPDTKVSSS